MVRSGRSGVMTLPILAVDVLMRTGLLLSLLSSSAPKPAELVLLLVDIGMSGAGLARSGGRYDSKCMQMVQRSSAGGGRR